MFSHKLALFCVIIFVQTSSNLVRGDCSIGTLTKQSAKKFAKKCDTVDGDLLISDETTLTSEELTTYFKNVKYIDGTLIVQNSSLENLDFLGKVEKMSSFFNDGFSIKIMGNSKLKYLGLSSLTVVKDKIRITDNPKLDLTDECEMLHSLFMQRRQISGNKKNCGCDLSHSESYLLTNDDFQSLPNDCETLYGDIRIGDDSLSYELLKQKLGSVKTIYGSLHVTYSNIVDLQFFESLESIYGLNEDDTTVEVTENPFLDRLFPKLTYTNVSLGISANFVTLCLSISELEALTMNSWWGITEYLCEDSFPEDVCIYNATLSELPDNCEIVVGDLIFENYDFEENEINKLKTIKKLFGQIVLINTNLENVELFSALEIIYFIHQYDKAQYKVEAIYMEKNEDLTFINFPQLEKIVYSDYPVVKLLDVYGLDFTKEDCVFFENVTNAIAHPGVNPKVLINWQSCEEYEEVKEQPLG